MKTPADKLIEIIEIIRAKITPDTDIIWTRYNSVDELKIDLHELVQGIRANNEATYLKLEILFGPTGSFQELSIANGWSEEFIQLSIIVDDQIEKVKAIK